MFMNLKHKQTAKLLAVEKTELLDSQVNDDDDLRWGATVITDSQDDMLSYI
jgi:hypothetical protein